MLYLGQLPWLGGEREERWWMAVRSGFFCFGVAADGAPLANTLVEEFKT